MSESAHSHAIDRAVIEKVLGVMQWSKHDETAAKISEMMQSLLEVEAVASFGIEYNVTALPAEEVVQGY